MLISLLLLFLAPKTSLGANTLSDNVQLESKSMTHNGRSYNGLAIHLGSGGESSQEMIFGLIDIAHPYSIIGDKTKSGWGIRCDAPLKNSCEVTNPNAKEDFASYFLYRYEEARVHFRFEFSKKTLVNDIKPMDFRLHVGGQKWFLNAWGSFGLSPESEIVNYLRRVFEKDISFGLKFDLDEEQRSSEHPNFSSFVIQNPIVRTGDSLLTLNISESERFWGFQGILTAPVKVFNMPETNVCLSSTSDEVILIPDAEGFCRAVQRVACSGQEWTNCTIANANLEKLAPLSLRVQNFNFTFTPLEYTFFDSKGLLQCRVGWISDLRSSSQCKMNAELGIGKLFFAKFNPIFVFGAKKKNRLVFVRNLEVKKPANLLYWAIVTLFGLILVALIIKFILFKKQQSDEEYEKMD